MSKKERNTTALRQARAEMSRHPSDCGSSEVQVASLTRRIAYMTEHLQAHPKDNHSRLGLMGMLANRKKLLQYLRRTDGDRYGLTISRLGLKDKE